MTGRTQGAKGQREKKVEAPSEPVQEVRVVAGRVIERQAVRRGQKARVSLMGPWGAGKAQPLDAGVLTPTGWTPMGEIRVGDEVLGSDGRAHRVTGVFDRGEREVFRVVTSDGSSTRCCAEHLWSTQTRLDRQAGRVGRGGRTERQWRPGTIKTTAEIAATLRYKRADGDEIRAGFNHYLPLPAPMEFSRSDDRPLPAYFLGLLLGDGCFVHHGREVTLTSADVELHAAAVASIDAPATTWRVTPPRAPLTRWGVPVAESLRSLGLLGLHSNSKFVPAAYMFAPVEDRLALLQGLFDTDGSPARGKGSKATLVEYTTVSARLAKDVAFLVRSLGGVARTTLRATSFTHRGERRIGQPSYRLAIGLPREMAPFRLARKVAAVSARTKYDLRRTIVAVEPAGVAQTRCIAVDAPDHLYITDDCLVTHNTWSSLVIAQELDTENKGILFIDTEHKSAEMFADVFTFAHVKWDEPYSAAELSAFLLTAEVQEYGVVIIDSLTHFWKGVGGILWQVDQAKTRFGGNSMMAWSVGRPLQESLVESLLAINSHLITCVRTKVKYEETEDARGKKSYQRQGTEPIQDDDLPYIFQFVGELDREHTLRVTKSRYSGLDNKVYVAHHAHEFGREMAMWLNNASETPVPQPVISRADANAQVLERLAKLPRTEMSAVVQQHGYRTNESGKVSEWVPTLHRPVFLSLMGAVGIRGVQVLAGEEPESPIAPVKAPEVKPPEVEVNHEPVAPEPAPEPEPAPLLPVEQPPVEQPASKPAATTTLGPAGRALFGDDTPQQLPLSSPTVAAEVDRQESSNGVTNPHYEKLDAVIKALPAGVPQRLAKDLEIPPLSPKSLRVMNPEVASVLLNMAEDVKRRIEAGEDPFVTAETGDVTDAIPF